MMQNFMLFSNLQKRVATSPIKTWRLLKQLRDDGRMKEDEDWQLLDRKLYVNVPRFIVELEQMGYTNLKSSDFINSDMKSDEIKKLTEEIRLISSEIAENQIQEEMKSAEIRTDESRTPSSPEPPPTPQSLKSNEIKMISPDIIESKNEVIQVLKDSLVSKDKDIDRLRSVIDALSKQNEITTRQNAWLTNLITAPKETNESVKSSDFRTSHVKSSDFNEPDLKSDDFSEAPASDKTPGAGDPSLDAQDTPDAQSNRSPEHNHQALG
jgi:hypothetical protein